MAERKKKNYVNNKDLIASILEYQAKRDKLKSQGKPPPKIPDYVALAIKLIAEKYSNKPNFRNYSYRDEMVEDGIEAALAAVDGFNIERTQNPFAYFTTPIYWAFLRRIEFEQNQRYIKFKQLENFVVEATLAGQNMNISEAGSDLFTDTARDFIVRREATLAARKNKSSKKKAAELDIVKDTNDESDY